MNGIDIYSANQTVTSWPQIKAAGYDWCYQKVSDGTTTRGAQSPIAGRNAGVLQGGYHFSQPGDPVGQANLLVDRCAFYGMFDLNPALDLEDNLASTGKPNIPDSQKADWAIAFGRQILARGHGFTLYANNATWTFIKTKVMAALPNTFRWVARYGAAPTNPYDAWQWSSSGHVPGITAGSVDLNQGAIPINGGNMALDQTDKDWIIDRLGNHPDWWYWQKFRGNSNYAQVIQAIQDSVEGLKTSLTNVTNLVIADDANDVTADAVANALRGLITSEVTPAVINAVNAALADVEGADAHAVSQQVLDDLRARLEL